MSLHSARTSLHGLYVILDPSMITRRSLVDGLKEVAAAGARLFQYRDKHASGREAYRIATELRDAAADAGALFVVNDRCDLALAVGADGVHLGQQDLPVRLARAIMGADKLIGLSTHTAAQVTEATAQGADYIGFGPIFATGTKANHEPVVGIDGLRQVRALTTLPIFAIGGVTVETAESLIDTGADGLAVISAIWKDGDPDRAVRQFMGRLVQPNPRALEPPDR